MPADPDVNVLEYDVDEAFALSSLPELNTSSASESLPKSGEPQRFTVQSTYFDTPDLRLLRAGLGIRRQTGSPDDGWHLRAGLADGAWHEMRAALGRSERTVPIQFRRLVWIHTRDVALSPVGAMTTEREVRRFGSNGQPPVEVIHERVVLHRVTSSDLADGEDNAEPVNWQRLRVTVPEGDPKLRKQVDRQLRRLGAERSTGSWPQDDRIGRHLCDGDSASASATGKRRRKKLSPTSGSGEVIVAYLAQELDRITSEDLSVRLDRPDSIHQMRVATRRLRSAFHTFGSLFEPADVGPLVDELKWLAGELGRARDAEVLRARLLDAVTLEQAQQQSTGRVTQAVDRETKRVQREAFAGVVAALSSDRYRALVLALEEVVTQPPLAARAARPARKQLRRLVAATGDRVRKSLDRAAALPAGEDRNGELHETRKAAKKARYAAEAVTPAFGKDAARLGLAMEHLQDVLGEYHDSVVMQERLHEMALGGTPATAFALGRLHAKQSAHQEVLERAIGKAAAAAEKKSLRAWLT